MVNLSTKLGLITCLVILFTSTAVAQAFRYQYVEVESKDTSTYKYQFGVFDFDEDLNLVKQDIETSVDQATFFRNLETRLNSLPPDKRNIFIYIHGMWGHQSWYLNQVFQSFDEEILAGIDHPYGIVLGLVWHAGMNYHDNVNHAYTVGQFYQPLVSRLLSLPFDKVKLLGHSMGNRVFQGIISNMQLPDEPIPYFDEVFYVAADLEENIFMEGNPLDSIEYYVGKSVIYVHNNDRSLGISKSLNENKRLGLNANTNTCKYDSSIWVIDASAVDDIQGLGPSLSNHRYFYTSPSVRKDLYFEITDLPGAHRIVLDHPRRIKIAPPKN